MGVSACLLGQRVRYDGRDKLQPWIEELAAHADWTPVCPEVELGLGVPRETIGLEIDANGRLALIATETRRDLTAAMREWAAARAEELAAPGLDGYVFKARSPSCGLGTVPVAGGEEPRDGLFAEAVRRRFPAMPLADEETLATPAGRARFLRLVRTHHELRELLRPGWTRRAVLDFHSDRKLLLMAHSPNGYARLGTLVGRMADLSPEAFRNDYVAGCLETIGEEPTPGRHANALAHAAGYFSQNLPPDDRAALIAAIENIGRGDLSRLNEVKQRIVDCARRFDDAYLLRQTYLTDTERL